MTQTKHDLPNFDKLWNYDDPAATGQKFRAILPETEGRTDYRLELETQIARTLGLQRKFDGANALLDQVEKQLTPEMKRPRVRYLLERGRAFNSSGRKDKAQPLFKEAWELANASGEEALAMDAAHMVAIASGPDESLAWNLKAIALAEASSNPKVTGWLGALYNNTGFSYIEKKDYDEAMVYFKKGLAYREAKGQKPETRIAKWTIAHTHRLKGEYQVAYGQQTALLKEIEVDKAAPDGFVYEELGECLLAMGKGEEAKPHFAKAYELLSKDEWLRNDEPKRLERLKRLSR